MSWLPRDREAYTHALMAKLPRGEVWPRVRGSILYKTVYGLMGIVARWAGDVGKFLLIEAFPPTSTPGYLLSDWERVLGLPEECLPVTDLTVPERQAAVREKLARRPGRQDRAYFIERAAQLGYDITITEYRPFMFGVSSFGDSDWRFAPHQMRFVWKVALAEPRLTWFRFGSGGGRTGQDPHLKIRRAEDLECLLRKLMPAHTKLIFSYSGV